MKNIREYIAELRRRGEIVVSENRRVSVKEYLSGEEKNAIAAEMANLIQSAETKEEDIKNVAAQMKQELKTIQGQISLNANLIATGYRMLMKPCVVIADFDRRVRILLDPETAEEVGTEPLNESDYQTRMDAEMAAPPPPPPPAPQPAPEPVPQLQHDGAIKVQPDGAIEADYEVIDLGN